MLDMKIHIAQTKTSLEILGLENILYRDLDFYVQNCTYIEIWRVKQFSNRAIPFSSR